MYGNARNNRQLGFWGYWLALFAAVGLTHAENYAGTVFRGGAARRLAKLVFWVLPVVWTMNAVLIFTCIKVFGAFPMVAALLGLIFLANAALETLKYTKIAIFG